MTHSSFYVYVAANIHEADAEIPSGYTTYGKLIKLKNSIYVDNYYSDFKIKNNRIVVFLSITEDNMFKYFFPEYGTQSYKLAHKEFRKQKLNYLLNER
jgi:hypothetical protein